MELWNQHPFIFWRKYWEAKKNGTLPEDFGYANHVGKGKGKGKKGEVRPEPTLVEIEKELKKIRSKKGKQSPEAKAIEQLLLDIREEEGGEDAVADKASKQRRKKREEEQFEHDTNIDSGTRQMAMKSFLKVTGQGFVNPENDDTLAKALQEECDGRREKALKKREQKLKQKQAYQERKRLAEEQKLAFIRQCEENSLKANNSMHAIEQHLERAKKWGTQDAS